MSMLCSIYRLTQEQVRMAQGSPGYVVQLLGQAPLPQKVGFLSRLFGRSSNAVVASAQALQPIAEGEIFELGQAWHILHFLFTGTAEEGEWPGGFVMSGGTEIGPDLGYGPARLFSAEQAREIAAFLDTQSVRSLDEAYVAQEIEAARVYWKPSLDPEERRLQIEDLYVVVQGLRTFCIQLVESKCSALVSIY
jgi:hypothetical protein